MNIYLLIWTLLSIPVSWVVTVFIISKIGWSALAAQYKTDSPFDGIAIDIYSASMNKVNYNNCLIIQYNKEGIHINPMKFFRLFHPPLFIPWKDAKEVRDRKTFLFDFKDMVIGDPFIATIGIQRSLFDKIESIAPSGFPNRTS
jgi:hypothetical protein